MSMNFNSLADPGRGAGSLGRAVSEVGQSLAARAQGLWQAYWDYQACRATVRMLEALDDRVLRDIGLGRSEIWPAVFGGARARPYDPHWRWPVGV
jgi:uncharacterized protein YjiS (DUF1127 family)